MNSRIYTQQQGEQAKVSRPHRKTVQMLKDLIRVNKDRITGYEKAAYRENELHQEKDPRQENESHEANEPNQENKLHEANESHEANEPCQENKLHEVNKPHRENNQIENEMAPDLNESDLNEMASDLRTILYKMAIASRSYVNDLHAEVIRLGGAPVTQDTITGKIYLFWLDCKADFGSKQSSDPAVSSSNPFLLLDACLCGEEAVQKAYRQALATTDDCPDNILLLLQRQLGDLERAHEQLKNIRNAYSDNHRSL